MNTPEMRQILLEAGAEKTVSRVYFSRRKQSWVVEWKKKTGYKNDHFQLFCEAFDFLSNG